MQRRIEPELKYCPKCNDEYRAEITVCVDCGIELISGSEILKRDTGQKPTRNMTISPDDEMVNIRKGAVIDMKLLQAMLKREGIPSLAASEDGSCGQGCCGPSLIVQVRKFDIEEVMAILEQDYIRSTGLAEHDIATAGAAFDATLQEATCPACGHDFSTTLNACPDCGLCFA